MLNDYIDLLLNSLTIYMTSANDYFLFLKQMLVYYLKKLSALECPTLEKSLKLTKAFNDNFMVFVSYCLQTADFCPTDCNTPMQILQA